MANDEKRVTYYDPPQGSIPDKIKQLIGNMVQTFWSGRSEQIRAWLLSITSDLRLRIDGYFDNVDVVQGIPQSTTSAQGKSTGGPSLTTYPMPVTSTGISGWIQRLFITLIGFSGYVGPYARLTQYMSEHFTHSARLDPASLAILIRRGIVDENEAIMHLADQGWTQDALSQYTELTRQKLDPTTVGQLLNRTTIDEGTALQQLREMGFSDADAQKIRQLYNVIPGIQDIITMAVKEAFSPEVANRFGQYEDYPGAVTEWANKNGLSQEWAQRYWAAHWDLPSATQGFEMLQRGIISHDELVLLLRALDVMPYWRDRLIQTAYTPFTRVDIRRMFNDGIITEAEVNRTYHDIGYDDWHAAKLTEWTIGQVGQANKDLTKSEVLTGYRRGLITEGEARSSLGKLGYKTEEIDYYIRYANWQNANDRAAPDKALQKADLVSAYKNGVTTRQELLDGLSALGYDDRERTLIANTADAQMQETKHVPNKQLAQSEVVTAYTNHLIDSGTLTTLLGQLGYDASETEFIVNLADFKIAQAYAKDTVDLIHAQFVNGTIDESKLITSLNKLNLPDITLQFYRYKWGLERESKVVTPTFSQFTQMYKKNVIGTDEFLHALETLGYQEPYKTWLYRLVTGLRPGEPAP